MTWRQLILFRLMVGVGGGLLAAGVVLACQALTLVVRHCVFDYRLWAGVVGIACQ